MKALVTLVGLLLTACLPICGQSVRFDSAWWTNANTNEQYGFVVGYLDCLEDSKRIPAASYKDFQDFVSTSVKSASNAADLTIPAILNSSLLSIKPQLKDPGAEVSKERHGWRDGEWWGWTQAADSQFSDEHKGYVGGFSSCVSGSPVSDTHEIDRIVTALDRYYASENHDSRKIAYVIRPLITSSRRLK